MVNLLEASGLQCYVINNVAEKVCIQGCNPVKLLAFSPPCCVKLGLGFMNVHWLSWPGSCSKWLTQTWGSGNVWSLCLYILNKADTFLHGEPALGIIVRDKDLLFSKYLFFFFLTAVVLLKI